MGEERIANELLVKLGIRVYAKEAGLGPRGGQRWRTFLRNHPASIVACDFCVVTASFRVLYIFVIIGHASDVCSNGARRSPLTILVGSSFMTNPGVLFQIQLAARESHARGKDSRTDRHYRKAHPMGS
jgi:hypothetical protein